MDGIKANERIRVEQDIDFVLKNMKLKILSQPHDAVLMVTDSRYKNYKTTKDSIIFKDGLLFRENCGEKGVSNTTKFSTQSNQLTKFAAACI